MPVAWNVDNGSSRSPVLEEAADTAVNRLLFQWRTCAWVGNTTVATWCEIILPPESLTGQRLWNACHAMVNNA